MQEELFAIVLEFWRENRPIFGIVSTHFRFDTFLLWVLFPPLWPERLKLYPLVLPWFPWRPGGPESSLEVTRAWWGWKSRDLVSVLPHSAFMFLHILHVASFKEEFLLLDDVDSQQPESSLLLCESGIGPPAACFAGWERGPSTANCERQSRMTQAMWSNPKNYGRNETTSQCAKPEAARLWLKNVLSHTRVNCCTRVSDGHHRGQERMPEQAPQPHSAPTQPGALQYLGKSGIRARQRRGTENTTSLLSTLRSVCFDDK